MNKRRWIPIVLAMLALGACSDDEMSDNGNEPQWNAAGKGYISLSLNLPTTGPNSKAESFEVGDESEYYVKDAKLLIFTGNEVDGDVSGTTFHSAYNLELNNWNKNENEQITTSTKITQEINSYQSEDIEAYALVVLNSGDFITITDEKKEASINGEPLAKGETTWGDVQKNLLSSETFSTENGILMLNAPLADKAGGSENPSGAKCTTLAPLHKGRIYESADKAASGLPAAIIYAERVVAKVSLESSVENAKFTNNEEDPGIPCEVTGWVLDNTNTESYFGHVVDRDWFPLYSRGVQPTDYRFVGSMAVTGGGTDDKERKLYRCYWAEDPNYAAQAKFNTAATVEGLNFLKPKDYAYCFENTSDISQMRNDQLTRVIVQVKFNEGNPFYTINDNANAVYTTQEALDNQLEENLKSLTGFDAWLKTNKLPEDSEFKFNWTTNQGQLSINKVTVNDMQIPEDFLAEFNKRNKIKEYKNGLAYYPVLIKHFGDDQTPWGTWETTDKPSPETSAYPGENAAANYLGRYGVVRNNWYQLNITSINKLGYPDVPPIENEPADNMDAYISVEINVLSWAKRTQNVDL